MIISDLQELTATLMASLGSTRTEGGDFCSGYFTLAKDEETGMELQVSLIDERVDLPRNQWGYALHINDDINNISGFFMTPKPPERPRKLSILC